MMTDRETPNCLDLSLDYNKKRLETKYKNMTEVLQKNATPRRFVYLSMNVVSLYYN